MVTLREALKRASEELGNREFTNPILDSHLLLSFVLNVDKTHIYLNLDETLKGDELELFYQLVERRAKGYPLQYILNSQEFMGLDFYVREGVLVPRPDTEILVERIIEIAKKKYSSEKPFKILEIGLGSGAIAVSLAYYLKNALVYGVDIDEVPLSVACENAKTHGVADRVRFMRGDMFSPFEKPERECFDIIVSNPPYIKTSVIEDLQLEVSTYEPKLALDGGDDGLCFYRAITLESANHLKSGGILAFEIGHDQAEEVAGLMEKDYFNIEVLKDYGGNDRVVLGYKKE